MEAVVNCSNSTQTGVSLDNHTEPTKQSAAPLSERLRWRKTLYQVPTDQLFELPGRPKVVYKVMDFSTPDAGASQCRKMVPFLFKSFESGQTPPSRLDKDRGKSERYQATIHEYLDWTVSASAPDSDNEPDFSGFRVILLQTRYRPLYPPPEQYLHQRPFTQTQFGAKNHPIPEILMDYGIPVAAATIRSGLNFLEIPFFATSQGKRSKGFGRTLLEAIEDVARGIGISLLLLCSTEEAKKFWCHMGFQFTQEADWKVMGVTKHDLLHMDNTVQMHKWLSEKKKWKSLILKHGDYVQRLYIPER